MSSDTPDTVAEFAAEYYEFYQLAVYENLFVGIVYGVYIVLYATSVHILLSGPGFTSSRPKMFMFGIMTFMFVLGSITLVLEVVVGFQEFQEVQSSLTLTDVSVTVLPSFPINVVIGTFSRLMYILSDIICAWRAVVLWNRDKRVIAVLLFFILGTIAAAVVDLNLGPYFSGASSETLKEEIEENGGYLEDRAVIFAVPTLVANLLSTGLIAWKFWQRRISVRKHLKEGSGSVRIDRVFAMLIESGFVYCCLWIFYLISAFDVLPEQGTTVMNAGLLFISGSYPTLIIFLVGMQMSPVEYHSTHSTGMQFTRDPALVPPSMQQHVYRNGRESVSDSDTQTPSAVFMKISDEEKSLSVG